MPRPWGRDWDWRANLYLPFGDRVRSLGSDSSASLSGASIQVTTTTREERALAGFDAELGWRTPLFDRDDPRQLRLYFGGYRFSDDKVMVAGPRVRAELALEELPSLWKGARLFFSAEAQYDSVRGSQQFLGLRLRIPLDKASRHGQLSAQARRMTAPVVRDVDIVTQSRVASTLVETASQLANGTAVTVISSATTTGAALPGAVAAAGANSTVILSGSFNTTASVILQTGQTLMGAGTLSVTTPSGRSASLTTPTATVSATGAADAAIRLANNSVLRGMTISSGGAGVSPFGSISGATIANNTITAGGVALTLRDSNNITVTGNSLSANSAGIAIALDVQTDFGGTYSAVVNNNTLSAAGATSVAIRLGGEGAGPGPLAVSGSGNVRAAGACIVPFGTTITGSIGFTDGSTCPP
ncbi:MAG: right-handed parallel beta-helix repeat-containing protein [Hydrogenophilaceae bacterium]|nr:right-handed parallel beta-helix repeat-containing protein [Hydrogenophilaceae bacterium]